MAYRLFCLQSHYRKVLVFSWENLRNAQTAYDKLMEMFSKSDAITLAEYRTELGVSRKFALFFLDYFDAQKITKMVGDKRVLVRKPT